MSKIEVDAIDKQSGSTLTIGGSGTTVQLGTGASQTGFGRTGTVDWQTTIKTADFTAASGEGYFCDTASVGAFTLTLPSSPSVGDIVALKDYASNFASANLTIGRGGSNLNGDAADSVRNTNNESLTLVYADATKGWLAVEEGTGFIGEVFIEATGGTITNSGNCRIHTFTGPGTFCVSKIATCAANNEVSYVVVAGGGSGGTSDSPRAGGGGAGGYRESKSPLTPYTASPLDGRPSAPNRVTVTATSFPITVGGGASGQPDSSEPGSTGNPSTFSTITSAGGGAGGAGSRAFGDSRLNGGNGGAGGGSGGSENTTTDPLNGGSIGSGNTPPVSPPQGQNGGQGIHAPGAWAAGGGGGGAGAVGGSASPRPTPAPGASGGAGGNGVASEITGSSVTRAGGGGASGVAVPTPNLPGGTGGGGAGNACGVGTAGTINTGGGGGAGPSPAGSGGGGSGIVIIRYKFQ